MVCLFRGGLKEQGFHLDWVWSSSGDNSLTMYLKPHLGPMRANTVLGEAVTLIWGEETLGVCGSSDLVFVYA